MDVERARSYVREVVNLYRAEPDHNERRDFFAAEKAGNVLPEARGVLKEHLRQRRLPILAPLTVVDVMRPNYIRDAFAEAQLNAERPLTKTQQDILWAQEKLVEYKSFSQRKHKDKLKANAFIRNTARELIADPEKMDTGLTYFVAHSSSEKKEKTSEFSERLLARLVTEVRDGDSLTAEQLAGIIKLYSRNVFLKDFSKDVLITYFERAESLKGKVDALYGFADASLELINDPLALREAAKIGNYLSDVIPRESDFYIDWHVARCSTVDDDDMLRRAAISELVFNGLLYITDLDYEEVQNFNNDYIRSERFGRAIVQRKNLNALNKDQRAEFSKKFELLSSQRLHDPVGDITQEVWERWQEWPYSVVKVQGATDPLRLKYRRVAEARVLSKKNISIWRKEDSENLPAYYSSYLLPDGLIFELFTDDTELADISDQVMQFALTAEVNTSNLEGVKNPRNDLYESMFGGNIGFKEHRGMYIIRKVTSSESGRHPLEFVGHFGFPTMITENVKDANETLRREILTSNVRFLDKRGFRVPFAHPEFKKLGYEYIEFHKDDDDPQRVRVILRINKMAVEVSLDKELNFDFKGQQCDISHIEDSLRFVMYSILHTVLCRDKAEANDGSTIDLKKIFKGRTGYLRFLQPHENRGADRAAECFAHEGRDLIVLSEARKRKHGTDRESTYVKPSKPDNTHFEPVVVNIEFGQRTLTEVELSELSEDLLLNV